MTSSALRPRIGKLVSVVCPACLLTQPHYAWCQVFNLNIRPVRLKASVTDRQVQYAASEEDDRLY